MATLTVRCAETERTSGDGPSAAIQGTRRAWLDREAGLQLREGASMYKLCGRGGEEETGTFLRALSVHPGKMQPV